MKRLLTLVVAVVMAFAVSPAFASVNNSAHDFLGSTYGRCGTCHVPHAASATTNARLWRADISATADGTWAHSQVGKLCGYCHNGAGGQTIANAAGTSTSSVAYHAASPAFASTSHGRAIARLTGAPLSHGALTSSRPYMGHQIESGLMECTSCHNPHNEGVNGGETGIRPFLIPGATSATRTSGFCNDCHDDRYTTTTSSTTNHPVLIAYNPSGNIPGDTRWFRAAVAGMNVPVPTAVPISNWSLGGKFEGNINSAQGATTSELIGCQSCHAVHNQDGTARASVAAANNANQAAYADPPRQLLAVTYANDAVCEGCHMTNTRAAGGTVGNGSDHPFDLSLTGVMALDGALWGTTEHGSNGGAICTSCHKAHGASVAMIRRAGDATNWCTSCHTSIAPAAHHSNNVQLPTSNVGCSDCHDLNGATAHNGFGFVFKLATIGGCQVSGCHGTGDPVNNGNAILANIPNSHLTAKTGTDASHFIGTFVNNAAKGINVKTAAWIASGARSTTTSAYLKNADGSAMIVGQSNYNPSTTGASATTVIRCESCHSVLGNVGRDTMGVSDGWNNNLLLQDYKDDSKNEAAARLVKSDFCIGCHNKDDGTNKAAYKLADVAGLVGNSLEAVSAITPPGIHPMTGSTITRAVDAGRSPSTLITASTGYADASTAPVAPGVGTNGTSYPAVNQMDCDSCHRPHLGKLQWTPTNATVVRSPSTVGVILEDGSADSFAPLCQDCHNY